MIKSLRITNPNPTTTTVKSNFDDFYTTGLMILEIAVNLCQNQLKKSSSDGNASATKTTINIFESQNCKSLKCTIKDPPKIEPTWNTQNHSLSKIPNSKSKLSEFSTKCQSLNHQERSQENQSFLKVHRWKFNKIIPKTKTFFPCRVVGIFVTAKKRGWNAYLTPTHYFFNVRILFWNGAAIKDWEKWRCGEVVKEKGESLTMLLGDSGRIRDSWGRDC